MNTTEKTIVVIIRSTSEENADAVHQFLKLVAQHPKPNDIARAAKKVVAKPSLIDRLFTFL